jgi:hypothetical protein
MRAYSFPLVFVILLLSSLAAQAQISPGKLSRAHEKLEGLTNCTSCHELGQKEISSAKCLECHTALQTRIAAGQGYHNSAEVRAKACSECHSDHNGREFELVRWPQGQNSFNHSTEGYVLEGAHRKAQCRDCHKPAFFAVAALTTPAGVNRERTFLGLSRECLHCHQDEHRDQLTDNCSDCHGYDAWSPAPKFSHSKTKYLLTGKHQEVDCAKCHSLQPAAEFASGRLPKKEHIGTFARYGGLDFQNCTPCHKDPHENKFGQNCQGCHTTANFHQIVGKLFDHNKTDFPLLGKHASVECAKCHKSSKTTDPIAYKKCSDCHKDAHAGQLADRTDKGACETCHTVDGFVPATYTLERHQECRYKLTGSHFAVPCLACHTKPAADQSAKFDFADLTCKGCHKDPHQGQLDKWIAQGGCEFCHSTETWHSTTFDHKLSRFALEGKHREKPCLSCHMVRKIGTSENVMWMKPIAIDCNSCHKDPHQGQFVRAEQGEQAANCQRCHTSQSWKDLTFVHNRDARYALDGAHAKVTCAECHPSTVNAENVSFVVYRPLKSECADCHVTRR